VVLSDVTHSQQVHAAFGGVVPELAARAHVDKIGVTVAAALHAAGLSHAPGARPDAVVATAGPGLVGAVLVGLCFGRSLAAAWDVPFLGVNHLEGHLLAALLEPEPPPWPFLCLVVSGGHTTLYLALGPGHYHALGSTIDDAAGEAYDKVARMLGLGYPCGPRVDALAATGDPAAVAFPRPTPGKYDFSFSGLKTAVRTALMKHDRPSDADVCASFQAAVVDVLVGRVVAASRETGVNHVAIGGGVAANRGLRAALLGTGLKVTLPPPSRCTDNAAMIAACGRIHLLRGRRDPLTLTVRPQWPLGEG
jgi:N6-L-threonylcarbamoyladenine synthase